MAVKPWNWRLWAGFSLNLGTLVAYVFWLNQTRAVFWPALLLFAVAALLLLSGLKRRSQEAQEYRGKLAGYVLTTLSVLMIGLFGLVAHQVSRASPSAHNAPQIGQPAPGFSLVGANGDTFTLTQLLSTPITDSGGTRATKGVLLVFYRGYW